MPVWAFHRAWMHTLMRGFATFFSASTLPLSTTGTSAISTLDSRCVCVGNTTCTCKELWVSCLVHRDGLVPCATSSCVNTILAVTEYDSVPSPTQQRCLRYFCDTSVVGVALHTETLYG